MPSGKYTELVNLGKQFHQNNPKTCRGVDVKKYRKPIYKLVQHYQARTMLDYGCGKGEQYTVPRHWHAAADQLETFDQWLELESVYKFDPWVEGLDQPPDPEHRFDCIICTQVVGNIPEEDFPWILHRWNLWATKFIFIGEINPCTLSSRHDTLSERPPRSIEWYLDLFKSWQGCPVYWYWKGPDNELNAWFDQNRL